MAHIDVIKGMTQREVILAHFIRFGSITSWEAFSEYHITRLSSIIYYLRKQGHIIVSQNKTTVSPFGWTSTYSEYLYKGLPDEE